MLSTLKVHRTLCVSRNLCIKFHLSQFSWSAKSFIALTQAHRQTGKDSVSVYKKKGREHCVSIITCDFFSSFFSSFLILPKYDLFGVPASEFIPIDITPCDWWNIQIQELTEGSLYIGYIKWQTEVCKDERLSVFCHKSVLQLSIWFSAAPTGRVVTRLQNLNHDGEDC